MKKKINKIVFRFSNALMLLLSSCTKTTKEYYANGILKAEYALIDGKKEGMYKEYYPSGELKIEAYYQQGLLNGVKTVFYQNGETKEFGLFKLDISDGFNYYYGSDGKIDSLKEWVLINPKCLNESTGTAKPKELAKSFLDTLATPKIAILNRCIYYDENQNVILKKSHFFDIFFDKDTISMNDSIKVQIVFHRQHNDLPNLFYFIQLVKEPFELFDYFEATEKKLYFYEKPRKKGINCVQGYILEGTPYRNDTVTAVLFVRKKYYVR